MRNSAEPGNAIPPSSATAVAIACGGGHHSQTKAATNVMAAPNLIGAAFDFQRREKSLEQQTHLLRAIVLAVGAEVIVVVLRASPAVPQRLLHKRLTVHPPRHRI